MALHNHHIGTALKGIRLQKNITQVELAESLSKLAKETINQSYISKIENGYCGVSFERLSLLCRALKCKPSDVVLMAENLSSEK